MSLQQRIDALGVQHGTNTPEFHAAVHVLMAQNHGPTPTTSAYSYPATPSSLHQASQGTPQVSSRGRTIKPSKPFSQMQSTPKGPPPTTATPAFARAGSSSLNPNAPRPSTRVPLSHSGVPVPPLTRVADSRFQALHSTYPSRMRLGTSSLMQPNAFAASGTGTSTPGPVASSKRARVINYAEIEGLDDSDDESNDAEVKARRAVFGGMVPKRLMALAGGGDGKEKVWGDGKSYLGVLPPGNLVVVQSVKPTKHVALCV